MTEYIINLLKRERDIVIFHIQVKKKMFDKKLLAILQIIICTLLIISGTVFPDHDFIDGIGKDFYRMNK